MRIAKILVLIGGLLLLASAHPAGAQTRGGDAGAARLPDGEGKEAVVEFCAGACHPSDRFLNLRQSPEEWRKTVLQMVSNGAQLFPEDIDAVSKYLGTYLSDKAAPAAGK